MAINFNVTIHADILLSSLPDRASEEILKRLDQLLKGQTTIMATQQQALDALAAINTATSQAATGLAALGVSLEDVSGDIDRLAAEVQNLGGAPALFDGLVAASAKVQTIADSVSQFAAFTDALAAKTADPVPVPVPVEPPPPPAPPL